MKRIALTAAFLVLGASIATAAQPGGKFKHGRQVAKYQTVKHNTLRLRRGRHHVGRLTRRERRAIARSKFRLAILKRRIWRDGRVTFFERRRLRIAQIRHRALVRRAIRS